MYVGRFELELADLTARLENEALVVHPGVHESELPREHEAREEEELAVAFRPDGVVEEVGSHACSRWRRSARCSA
jgi:hypothetical protein